MRLYAAPMITIDIVSDTVCPWCFIGKRRLEQALAERPDGEEIRIEWKPFQLNPDMPEAGIDRKSYLEAKFGGPEGARQVYQNIQDAGATVGLDLKFDRIPRTPNTVDSHRLIDRAGQEGCQDAVVEALFRAYFMDGKDIGDLETLVAAAESAGMDAAAVRAYLESDEDCERIRNEDAMARRMGVQGVPCFIINRKYAVSGAQDPAVFHQVFERVAREGAEEAKTAEAE